LPHHRIKRVRCFVRGLEGVEEDAVDASVNLGKVAVVGACAPRKLESGVPPSRSRRLMGGWCAHVHVLSCARQKSFLCALFSRVC
jgi:hypothetical protein